MNSLARFIVWCLALTLVALPIVGVLRGWFAADRWPVRRLVLQADYQRVSEDQLKMAIQPALRRGFFAVDLDRVCQRVQQLPWVESVEARKQWPDTLRLKVYERQPFAHWNGEHLISQHGQRFDTPADVALPDLPDLRGPDTRMGEVMDFYREVSGNAKRDRLDVTGVELSERGSWSLTMRNGARIVMGGREHAQAKLERFLAIYPRLGGGRAAFHHADLRYTNGFAVRWATPSSFTPVAGVPHL